MGAGATTADAAPPTLTAAQRDVDRRARAYHEALVRNAYLTHPNWARELGWSKADADRYYRVTTACEILRYRRPKVLRYEQLLAGALPIVPLTDDNSYFRGLARLEIAERAPDRAAELFGGSHAAVARPAYWRRVLRPVLQDIDVLMDNADFGLNVLIRVLYLHGRVPRRIASPWRAHTELSPNFDDQAQARIERALLAFKYWHDEPFRAVDEPALHAARRDHVVRTKEAENRKKQGRGEPPDEITADDRDTGKYRFEMQYWSENHQALFATAEYLAGQWLPDATFHPGLAYRSHRGYRDVTGRERMRRAHARLDAWLGDRLRFGLSEWNAPGYYDEHVIAMMNLADFALDESIRIRACMVLDLIVFDLARFTQGGSFGVSASRAHFKHKNCGWHQSPGDLVEILFGTRHGAFATLEALSACAVASGRRYQPPDALLTIGRARPAHWIDRTRASIDWNEAAEYGIGFDAEPDVMRWWSRGSWFTKHLIHSTRRLVKQYGLEATEPFSAILPGIGTAADALTGTKLAAYVAAGPAFPVLVPLLGDPTSQEDEIANALSIVTEGSAYTRGNVYTYRNRHAILSSTQNHHAGQLSFQGSSCQATLGMCATVFTTHPSAGGGIDKAYLRPAATVAGATGGALVGGLLGPAGAVVGAYLGGKKGSEVKDVKLLPASGDGPDWWTGSVTQPRVVQIKGAAILAYKPKAFQLLLFGHRFHAWFPQDAFDDLPAAIRGQPPGSVEERRARSAAHFPFRKPSTCNVDTGRWVFGRAGDGYIGLFSGQMPAWTHESDGACKEILVQAERNVFIIQIGDVEEFGSYDAFIARVLRARIHVNGLNWKLSDFQCSYDVPNGSRLELHYDDNQVRYAGLPFSDDAFPRLDSSFAQVAWQQRRYVIQHGGASLMHDVRRQHRTVGGPVRRLEHDADLRVYGQNMGLFYIVAPYAGTERDAALGRLIAVLRDRRFDVVGLSEMWHEADRERIVREVGHIYRYHLGGPEEIGATEVAAAATGAAVGGLVGLAAGPPGVVGGAIAGAVIGGSAPLGSGLFLLSRHKIIAANGTIYRQCAGEDCAADKGAMHVRIHPQGLPCPIDVFLSHTQNLTPLIDDDDARDALVAQIRHLAAFVQSCRDHRCPALLLGDLNVDALDASDQALYGHLVAELRRAEDLRPTFKPPGAAATATHPDATSERTDSGVSSFPEGSAARPVDDPARCGDAAQRLDYLWAWNGTLFEAHYDQRDVVDYQSSPGRDMSDHYGVQARLATITQLLPPTDTPIRTTTLQLSRFRCLDTTSGPGSDEVVFTLRGIAGDGRELAVRSALVDEVDQGDGGSLDSGPLAFGDPGEFLIVHVTGIERDDLSANDSLGSSHVWLPRQELLSLMGRPTPYTFRLTGDGAEYAVEVMVTVQ